MASLMENFSRRWNGITARRHQHIKDSLSRRRINNPQQRREIITRRHEEISKNDQMKILTSGQITIWSNKDLLSKK